MPSAEMERLVPCVDARNSFLNRLFSIVMVSIVHRNGFGETATIMLEEITNITGVTNVLEISKTANNLNSPMFRYVRSNLRRKRTTKLTRKAGFNVIVVSDGCTRFVHSLILVKTKTSAH